MIREMERVIRRSPNKENAWDSFCPQIVKQEHFENNKWQQRLIWSFKQRNSRLHVQCFSIDGRS